MNDSVAGSPALPGKQHQTRGGDAAHQRLIDNLAMLLRQGALPGELADFTDEDCRAAAEFIAACVNRRPSGIALVRLESVGTKLGQRRMRIGIANDDMPFLVDSVADAIAARGLIIHRLLHPVVCVDRDEKGCLIGVEPLCDDRERRESMMYIEVDRADARVRAELVAELHRVLADVRAAVTDWRAMQAQDARRGRARSTTPKARALLHWFADGAMTLLGYEVERPGEAAVRRARHVAAPRRADRRGRLRGRDPLFRGGRRRAADRQGRPQARRSTAACRSTSSSCRCARSGKITGIGVHAGLWTSEALSAPVEEVPLLRRQLDRAREGVRLRAQPAIAARRCATPSPRCRATCWSTCSPRR